MKAAAIGVRVHSGWGALVAVSGWPGAIEVLDRRKMVIIDPASPGVKQPYHHVAAMAINAAERHLVRCASESKRLGLEAIKCLYTELKDRGFTLVGSAILLSSVRRDLPALERILASHALIHTAEGEFFRQVFRQTFEDLDVPVTGIRERELDERAFDIFGKDAAAVRKSIDGMGRSLGPPWTQDEKLAALSAAIVLAESHAKSSVRSKVHTF
ncbi:MAG TPA: hypothetical protein VGH51_00870 [Candidatus Angelobacter sp.]